MRLGLRAMLLLLAIVMFVLALLMEENALDLLAFGLALLSAALLVGDLGLDRGRGRFNL